MSSESTSASLPGLRPELRLLDGAKSSSGEPTWLVHDPLMNRFVQIDLAAYETLRHWQHSASAEDLIDRVNRAGNIQLDAERLDEFTKFLDNNKLFGEPGAGAWKRFAQEREARQQSLSALLIHNYLFFRLPLCRPQAFLEATWPVARKLASRTSIIAISLMGLIGLYFASRQASEFFGSLHDFFNWEGFVLMAFVLLLVKAAHELGHAYSAVRYGCRVHSMGVAFVVMAPLLYTDVTDAWRLKDRRQRLMIDSAGIRVEIAIAAVALFLWSITPDGAFHSVALMLCTVSLVSTLAINLNPFMRFDGYYLLCEAAQIENLQDRSFNVGVWKLREILFGLNAPCPENLPKATVNFMAAYAYAVWIYRLFLFIGIALLVYHYFFKVLGLILFAVEIIYFVARPIIGELKVWYGLRPQIFASRRSVVSMGALVSALLVSLVPWSTAVEIPAVVESARLQAIHAPRSARIVSVEAQYGDLVKAGQTIIKLESPEVRSQYDQARTSLKLAQLQYARRIADADDRDSSLILQSSIAGLKSKLKGLEKERQELEIKSPFDGRLVDLNPHLHPLRWIGSGEQIGVVATEGSLVARGYVSEEGLRRIVENAAGVFIPDNAVRPKAEVRIKRIAAAATASLEIADLASIHQGRVEVVPDAQHRLVPVRAQYLVQMGVSDAPALQDLSVRGVVVANGQAESLLARLWRHVLGVLVRESGF